MALVLGTNTGFVTAEPSPDPDGSTLTANNYALSTSDTSPADAFNITKCGWWCHLAQGSTTYQIGVYSNNAVPTPDAPNVRLGYGSGSVASGEWNRATVSITDMDTSTTHHICLAVTNEANTYTEYGAISGVIYSEISSTTTLPESWTRTNENSNFASALYALYEAAGGDAIKVDRARPIGIFRGMRKQMWGNF